MAAETDGRCFDGKKKFCAIFYSDVLFLAQASTSMIYLLILLYTQTYGNLKYTVDLPPTPTLTPTISHPLSIFPRVLDQRLSHVMSSAFIKIFQFWGKFVRKIL
jgi:hypothetical protein